MKVIQNIIAGALIMAAAACTTTSPLASKDEMLSQGSSLCQTENVAIDINYQTSRVNQCDILSDKRLRFTIRPEEKTDPQGAPINNSAWYGFKVVPKVSTGALRVELKYENGKHRYHPKISYDGTNWKFLDQNQLNKISDDKIELSLPLGGESYFISAQEIFTPKAHNEWTAKLAKRPDVRQITIGQSWEGRPINMLEVQTDPDVKKPYVVWVGRQHPPELTGALALIPFTEEVLNESDLSNQFLDQFNVLIVPMINPDGVVKGNWRFNMGGMDLNRDWGPFSQPETLAVYKAFKRFENKEDKIVFFLDFHSTWRNLLYTQADDEPTSPPMFARDWLKAVDDRLDDDVYPFTREARHNSGKPISKNYMYNTYGISAITYEVGDATPRSAIDLSARVFAQEMMKLLLEHERAK